MRSICIQSKLFAVAFFLFVIQSYAYAQQPIEIVIVGSSHSNGKGTDETVINKLLNYAPDMVFGEYVLPAELKALHDTTDVKKSYVTKYNYIKKRNAKAPRNLEAKIKKGQTSLTRNNNNHLTRIELARNYVLNYDRGNAEYQLFVLENYMKPQLNQKELQSYELVLGTADSLKKVKLLRPGTEYEAIFFPLVYKLNHQQIYSMDCQNYDEEWNKVWAKAGAAIKAMEAKAKAEPASAQGLAVTKIKQHYKELDSIARAEKMQGYAFLNSDFYAKADAAVNFYGGEAFFNEPGFPTEAIKAMMHPWNLRNEAMCQNILKQAQAKGAKRLVVAVGASHRKWMEEIFAQMPEVKIINYNALP